MEEETIFIVTHNGVTRFIVRDDATGAIEGIASVPANSLARHVLQRGLETVLPWNKNIPDEELKTLLRWAVEYDAQDGR